MIAAHSDDESMFGKETIICWQQVWLQVLTLWLGFFHDSKLNMKQESKLTQAKIYVKWAIYLAELKDAFTLESRQNLCMEKYLSVFIQMNTYTAIDFNFL